MMVPIKIAGPKATGCPRFTFPIIMRKSPTIAPTKDARTRLITVREGPKATPMAA